MTEIESSKANCTILTLSLQRSYVLLSSLVLNAHSILVIILMVLLGNTILYCSTDNKAYNAGRTGSGSFRNEPSLL